jgi:hypothetical protein
MNTAQYQRFTDHLLQTLSAYPQVCGLVTVGSMAAVDYMPDEWSDHDFFLIVEPGGQEFFRTDFRWLPDPDDIVFSYRETAHGVKVFYRSAHLVEFAVFDRQELSLARINRYRVLLDRGGIEALMSGIRQETIAATHVSDRMWLFGQFLSNLLVGVGRHRRGELMSAFVFVKYNAARHLALLCHQCLESPTKNLLDNLDPFRRLERAFPEESRILSELLRLDTPQSAVALLGFAQERLAHKIPGYPAAAVEAVGAFLNRTEATEK